MKWPGRCAVLEDSRLRIDHLAGIQVAQGSGCQEKHAPRTQNLVRTLREAHDGYLANEQVGEPVRKNRVVWLGNDKVVLEFAKGQLFGAQAFPFKKCSGLAQTRD